MLVFTGHKSEVLAIDASPVDRRFIATGGMDDVGIIWDLDLNANVGEVDGGKESVSTVAFSVDGKYVAFGSENGAISVVFMDGSSAPGTPLDGPGDAIHFLSWHPRGPVLLAGSADHVAYMWNASKAMFMMAFAGHEDAVTCGSFTGDGKLVVTASMDSSLRIWNPTAGTTIARIQTGIPGIRSAFHSADILALSSGAVDTSASKLVATGCAGGSVFITHIESGHILNELPRHTGGVECVSFSPTSMRPCLLATAGGDGLIRVYDIDTNAERCAFSHPGVISAVRWHPTQPLLVSASSEGTVALWNVLSGQRLKIFHGHSSIVNDVCFAGGNEFVASTSADGSVRVFDIRPFL